MWYSSFEQFHLFWMERKSYLFVIRGFVIDSFCRNFHRFFLHILQSVNSKFKWLLFKKIDHFHDRINYFYLQNGPVFRIIGHLKSARPRRRNHRRLFRLREVSWNNRPRRSSSSTAANPPTCTKSDERCWPAKTNQQSLWL